MAVQARIQWREQMAKEHQHPPEPVGPSEPAPKHKGKVESVEAHREVPDPEPGVAKMLREKGADGKNLDKPPVAPTAPSGPLPRLVHQNERAPAGTVRYKIRCDNYHPQPTRYILVKAGPDARQQARECYLHATRLDAHIAHLRENSKEPDKVDLPSLAVTELPD